MRHKRKAFLPWVPCLCPPEVAFGVGRGAWKEGAGLGRGQVALLLWLGVDAASPYASREEQVPPSVEQEPSRASRPGFESQSDPRWVTWARPIPCLSLGGEKTRGPLGDVWGLGVCRCWALSPSGFSAQIEQSGFDLLFPSGVPLRFYFLRGSAEEECFLCLFYFLSF